MLKRLILALALSTSSAYADGCISPPTTNFSSAPFSITTTAVQIAKVHCRNAITIVNNGATPLTIGATSAVTTSNGGSIPSGGTITLQTNAAMWAVSTGSETISVFETY